MLCEVCGSKEANFRAMVEGTSLLCCQNCSRHGQQVFSIQQPKIIEKKTPLKQEPSEEIVDDCGTIVKKTRESTKLSQKDFAAKINEKESLIHSIESGHVVPSIDLARKLERLLGIKIIEKISPEPLKLQQGKEIYFTIGDNLKVRKR